MARQPRLDLPGIPQHVVQRGINRLPCFLDDIARLMQKLGRKYVGRFNARHQRTGTLWEGRYKACLVDSDSYVLRCHRYIDLNPVRARITDNPVTYPWSSCATHCGTRREAFITPHPAYLNLSPTPEGRAGTYRKLLQEAPSDDDLAAIRIYLQQQRALGRDDFRAMVEAKTRRFAGVRPAHRPGAQEVNLTPFLASLHRVRESPA